MAADALKKWFLLEKRDLPWRTNTDSYRVWVSEVMLQQTQVSVVIPYFERWMRLFPTVQILAESGLETVIKAWEGLGYYSRARNLHAGAKMVVAIYGGKIPDRYEELIKLKGLGPYTANAILSFAFHQKRAPVDGNVARVLSRLFEIEDDFAKPATLKQMQRLAEELLPEEESWIYNEALIELGAKICQKRPKCIHCPLLSSCRSYASGKASLLPIRSRKTKYEKLIRQVAVLVCGSKVLLRRCEKNVIMSDLYEFPYFEKSEEEITARLKKNFGIEAKMEEALALESHSFTRFRVQLLPFLLHTNEEKEVMGYQWHETDLLQNLPFSSGHKRILNQFLQRK